MDDVASAALTYRLAAGARAHELGDPFVNGGGSSDLPTPLRFTAPAHLPDAPLSPSLSAAADADPDHGGAWPARRFSIAPMMEVTDRHFRWMTRQLSKRCLLYTEMVVDQTLLHNMEPFAAREFFLGHSEVERPLAVQLGGNDPASLGLAAKACEEFGGYSEINLNCGCPSPKVSERCFGARLMLDPERVRRIVSEMGRMVTHTEVTVKCRIGADERDSYPELCEFVAAVKAGGVRRMTIHARKCHLDGMSASANRNIPPLHYEGNHDAPAVESEHCCPPGLVPIPKLGLLRPATAKCARAQFFSGLLKSRAIFPPAVVHQLARDFPDMTFDLNGGVLTVPDALAHLRPTAGPRHHHRTGGDVSDAQWGEGREHGPLPFLDGVMVGRFAWHQPWGLRAVDSTFFGAAKDPMAGRTRRDLIDEYCDYAVDMQVCTALVGYTDGLVHVLSCLLPSSVHRWSTHCFVEHDCFVAVARTRPLGAARHVHEPERGDLRVAHDHGAAAAPRALPRRARRQEVQGPPLPRGPVPKTLRARGARRGPRGGSALRPRRAC